MAESSETSLRDAQILDGDGALANEAANKYLMTARAEAVERIRSGQVRYITRPKSETMRVTRQLGLPPRYRGV